MIYRIQLELCKNQNPKAILTLYFWCSSWQPCDVLTEFTDSGPMNFCDRKGKKREGKTFSEEVGKKRVGPIVEEVYNLGVYNQRGGQ